MLGNCATGKLRMVRAPTITRTIEITMATMGRLMKNFDIGLPSFVFAGVGLGSHRCALPHLLHAFGDDAIARLEPAVNDPVAADAVAHLNSSDFRLVVGIDNRDLVTALQLGDGALRNHQRVVLDADHGANLSVAAGTQNVSRIWKQAGNSNRACAFVYLAVSEEELALVWVGRSISENHLEVKILVRFIFGSVSWEASSPFEILGLPDGEVDLDGIDG